MSTKPNKVTATVGATPDSVRIMHNDFPDFRADGDSLEDAADTLIRSLSQEITEVEDDSVRDSLRQAVAEVQAFIEPPEAD